MVYSIRFESPSIILATMLSFLLGFSDSGSISGSFFGDGSKSRSWKSEVEWKGVSRAEGSFKLSVKEVKSSVSVNVSFGVVSEWVSVKGVVSDDDSVGFCSVSFDPDI